MIFRDKEIDNISTLAKRNVITMLGRQRFEVWTSHLNTNELNESYKLHSELHGMTVRFGVLITVKAVTSAYLLAVLHQQLPMDLNVLGGALLAVEVGASAASTYLASAARDAIKIVNGRLHPS